MQKQLVIFRVGTGDFAVDILTVREVVPVREITPVPETPDYVEGVMNLRGLLIPVLDLRRRMQAPADHPPTLSHSDERRIIICHFDNRLVGVQVDSASEVVRISDEKIEPTPEILFEIGASYVTGVVLLGERVVTMVDLQKALGAETLCELGVMLEAVQRSKQEKVAV